MLPFTKVIDQLQERGRRLYEDPVVKEMKRRAAKSFSRLTPIYNRTQMIKPGAKLLVTMGRDESNRIPYFLEYYRKLGIDHFLFVDNQSDPPMAELMGSEPDVSLWHTDEGYADANFGVDWMNGLLLKHAVGHWVLTVDLDEFFVYPFMGSRSYNELLSFLNDSESLSFFTMLVDMYPEGPIAAAQVPSGESPLTHAPYFDRVGYYAIKGGHGDTWVRGGPRLRAFNSSDFAAAPSINKTPLIKWQTGYVYYLSTHVAYPALLNHAHRKYHGPTGALLHFKFVSSFREKIDYAVRMKNHYGDSREYQKYLDHLQHSENFSLHSTLSAKYLGPESLINTNIMTAGCWK